MTILAHLSSGVHMKFCVAPDEAAAPSLYTVLLGAPVPPHPVQAAAPGVDACPAPGRL